MPIEVERTAGRTRAAELVAGGEAAQRRKRGAETELLAEVEVDAAADASAYSRANAARSAACRAEPRPCAAAGAEPELEVRLDTSALEHVHARHGRSFVERPLACSGAVSVLPPKSARCKPPPNAKYGPGRQSAESPTKRPGASAPQSASRRCGRQQLGSAAPTSAPSSITRREKSGARSSARGFSSTGEAGVPTRSPRPRARKAGRTREPAGRPQRRAGGRAARARGRASRRFIGALLGRSAGLQLSRIDVVVRRLPVIQTPPSEDAEAHARSPWKWVLIGAGFTITLWLPLATLAAWLESRVLMMLSFIIAATVAGVLVGKFGLRATARTRGARRPAGRRPRVSCWPPWGWSRLLGAAWPCSPSRSAPRSLAAACSVAACAGGRARRRKMQ